MWRRIGIAAALLGSLFSHGAVAGPKQADTIRLSVSVFNDAEVRPFVLATAQRRAEIVLAEAGVEVIWLDCGTPGHWATGTGCSALAYPTHLSVRLAKDGTHRAKDAFGESFLDDRGEGNYASVYMAPLASSKALGVVDEGNLLGYVIAHELGHLLLGENSHSPEGVMRAVWQFEDLWQAAMGRLLFTATQAERMRARYLAVAERRRALEMSPASGK